MVYGLQGKVDMQQIWTFADISNKKVYGISKCIMAPNNW